MKETKTFPPNIVHNDDTYYLPVLLLCIDGLTKNQTHSQIAANLNAAGLRTPRGDEWSAPVLKQVLKRIRNWRDYKSSFHSALLRLVYAGSLTVQQTQVLFALRTTGVF